MKRIIEDSEPNGLESLLGKRVLLMCANYFYEGKLIGVNKDFVLLEDPSIVYETGEWSNKGFADKQALHTGNWYVRVDAIESYGVSK
jgi:hypothetical protein